jgi:hypothetical protein
LADRLTFSVGDALAPDDYPTGPWDMVVSLGFTEFLDDDEAVRFYRIVRERLRPAGRLVTSGMRRRAVADYLLRNVAELEAHYRGPEQLRRLAREAGFEGLWTYQDPTGIQTMLVATDG